VTFKRGWGKGKVEVQVWGPRKGRGNRMDIKIRRKTKDWGQAQHKEEEWTRVGVGANKARGQRKQGGGV